MHNISRTCKKRQSNIRALNIQSEFIAVEMKKSKKCTIGGFQPSYKC